ncbi:MAG: type II toxin-antitoxin system VapC family toxin [Leeuwenhoekiella sp.]
MRNWMNFERVGSEVSLGHKYCHLLPSRNIILNDIPKLTLTDDKWQPCISVISEIELLSWKSDEEEDIRMLNEFLEKCEVIEFNKAIKLQTADIRKLYSTKLPDAIIAATALSFDIPLMTRNIKDFQSITDLQLLNPF